MESQDPYNLNLENMAGSLVLLAWRTRVGSKLDGFFGIRTFKGFVPLRKLRHRKDDQ